MKMGKYSASKERIPSCTSTAADQPTRDTDQARLQGERLLGQLARYLFDSRVSLKCLWLTRQLGYCAQNASSLVRAAIISAHLRNIVSIQC